MLKVWKRRAEVEMNEDGCAGCGVRGQTLEDNYCSSCVDLIRICKCRACKQDIIFYPQHDDYEVMKKTKIIKEFICNDCLEKAACIHCGTDAEADIVLCDNCGILGATCTKCWTPREPLREGLVDDGYWDCKECRATNEEGKKSRNRNQQIPKQKGSKRDREISQREHYAKVLEELKEHLRYMAQKHDNKMAQEPSNKVAKVEGMPMIGDNAEQRRIAPTSKRVDHPSLRAPLPVQSVEQTKIKAAEAFADAYLISLKIEELRTEMVAVHHTITTLEASIDENSKECQEFKKELAEVNRSYESATKQWLDSRKDWTTADEYLKTAPRLAFLANTLIDARTAFTRKRASIPSVSKLIEEKKIELEVARKKFNILNTQKIAYEITEKEARERGSRMVSLPDVLESRPRVL